MKALTSLLFAVGHTSLGLGNSLPPLVTVSISPESRVKAAAEDGPRRLQQGEWRDFGIVIDNAAGITAPLVIECQQTMTCAADDSRDRWLQLALHPTGPLTGQPLESRTLRLWSRDSGVRSAVFSFNAGQGTQDLGFRSDVTLTFRATAAAKVDKTPVSPTATLVATGGGLWPQIQLARDGSLLAFGYNAAAHTTLPGDVDCWASPDGGKTWALRATAASRPASHANYCHFATGLAANGDALILASGMDHAASINAARGPHAGVILRSADSGKTWEKSGTMPGVLPGQLKPYPFGSIIAAADKTLRTVMYTVDEKQNNIESAWMFTSRNDGRTWAEARKVADGINETVILPLGGKTWLGVARTSNRPAPAHGQEFRQFRSADDGKTWADEGLIASCHLHPPHLLRLRDNRILLTCGNRLDGGIESRLSSDDGKGWSEPRRLFTTGPGDMGYPSTAQLPDGTLVTVFYAQQSPLHDGYHMGAVGWATPAINQ